MFHMPQDVLDVLDVFNREGLHVISITGHQFHSVGIDEGHEMLTHKAGQ